MASIRSSIEIARSAEDVFEYSADPTHRSEWQDSVRDTEITTPGPVGMGTRVREIRAVTGGDRTVEWEYARFEAPSAWGFKGVNGPVRPVGVITFTELPGTESTRVDMEIDFEGSGLGRLLVPLARRDARKQMPADLSSLKRRLERAATIGDPQPL
jgi:uncharacterized protein YndB with AHSA1/START domain